MEYQKSKITNRQIDMQIIESKCQFNSLGTMLPYSYVIETVNLNWHDILFAINNGFLDSQTAIEHAIDELEHDNNPKAVLDLACLSLDEAIHQEIINPYIYELADLTPEHDKNQSKSKIMYVLLKWIFSQRETYDDPLRVVEIIYDDFGFPKEMVDFVRYLPTSQYDLGSYELNYERLLNNWGKFLERQKMIFTKSGNTGNEKNTKNAVNGS